MPDGQPDDSPETVPYQFEIPAPLWVAFKQTISQSETVKGTLLGLLREAVQREDSAAYVLAPDRDPVAVESGVWREWADTVPRSTPLAECVETILQQDAGAVRAGGYTQMEEKTARLLASRIGHRSRTAQTALDHENAEKVREELAEIETIAGQFDE